MLNLMANRETPPMAKEKVTPAAPETVVRLNISGHIADRKGFVKQIDKLLSHLTNGRAVCSMRHAPERT